MPRHGSARRLSRRLLVASVVAACAVAVGHAVPAAGERAELLPVVSGREAPVTAPPPAAPLALVADGPDDVRSVASAPKPVPVDTLTGYVWPLARGRLTQDYGPSRWGGWRTDDGTAFHDGIDLATFCGDRVVAAHDGVVLTAGRRFDPWLGWRGDLAPYYARLDEKQMWTALPIVVVIDDGNTYRSMYAHLSRAVVRRGDRVRAGQLIGYEGATGRASGCHLHYGLFSPFERDTLTLPPDVAKRMKLPARETARVDPLRVLPPRPKPSPKPSASPAAPAPDAPAPVAASAAAPAAPVVAAAR